MATGAKAFSNKVKHTNSSISLAFGALFDDQQLIDHGNTIETMYSKAALLALAAFLPASIAQVSEGFENGWDQTAWPTYAPDCNQGGKVTLDSSTAHTGKNSIRVDGAGGYCGHIFVGTTKIPSGDVYVRTYL